MLPCLSAFSSTIFILYVSFPYPRVREPLLKILLKPVKAWLLPLCFCPISDTEKCIKLISEPHCFLASWFRLARIADPHGKPMERMCQGLAGSAQGRLPSSGRAVGGGGERRTDHPAPLLPKVSRSTLSPAPVAHSPACFASPECLTVWLASGRGLDLALAGDWGSVRT